MSEINQILTSFKSLFLCKKCKKLAPQVVKGYCSETCEALHDASSMACK
jgi:hypothetical protein